MASWWRWWASRGWASPAWSRSASTHLGRRDGWCWRAAPCRMAKPPRISRSSTCSKTTAASTPATIPGAGVRKSWAPWWGSTRPWSRSCRRSWRCWTCRWTRPTGSGSTPHNAASAPWRRSSGFCCGRANGSHCSSSVEDLHWIDAETQACLDSLVESLPTARLLLLVNYRPEYQHGWGRQDLLHAGATGPAPPRAC